MAIKIKDLINKRHEGRVCVAFDYVVAPMDKNRPEIIIHYVKKGERFWRVFYNDLCETESGAMRCLSYSVNYAMPMDGMALVLVCAYGLRVLSNAFAETIQDMSAHEFTMVDSVKDM